MKEQELTFSTGRTMYSLVDAAELAGCSIDDLLQHGALGKLPILVRVPDNVLVYATNRDLLGLADPSLVGLMRQRGDT